MKRGFFEEKISEEASDCRIVVMRSIECARRRRGKTKGSTEGCKAKRLLTPVSTVIQSGFHPFNFASNGDEQIAVRANRKIIKSISIQRNVRDN